MSSDDRGSIVEVSTIRLGDELLVPAAAGATTLTVADAVDFHEDGGSLTIGTETLDYLETDDDTGVLTLAVPLAGAYPEGEPVVLNPEAREKYAQVMVGDFSEAVQATIPHSLWDRIPDGVRAEGEGEVVELELDATEYVVANVVGSEPDVDGSYIDPATLPANPELTQLRDDLTALDTELTTAQGQITQLNTDLGTLDSELDAALPITAVNLADDAVTAAKIAAGAVGASEIADGAVANTKLVDNAVTAVKIATGAITETKISDDAITTPKIAAGAVTASEVAAGAIVAGKIAAGAVTATELAAGSVVAGKIAAGAVTATEIAAGSVSTVKLAAGAVTANEVAANAIEAGKIATNAVTAGTVAAGAITTAKLAAGAVTANEVAAGAITTLKLAAGAVTANEIGAGAVTTLKLAAGAVTANEIAAGTITAAKMAAGSIVIGATSGTTPITYAAGYDPSTKETPTGAQAKADTAQSAAVSTAAGDATTKASNAQTAAINDATTKYDNARQRVSQWQYTGQTTINGGQIQADTITAVSIAAGAISAAELAADAIDGKTITGAYVRTRSSGTRVELGVNPGDVTSTADELRFYYSTQSTAAGRIFGYGTNNIQYETKDNLGTHKFIGGITSQGSLDVTNGITVGTGGRKTIGLNWDATSVTTNLSGRVTIPHGLGGIPVGVWVTSYRSAWQPFVYDRNISNIVIEIRGYDGTIQPSQTGTLSWLAMR